MERRERKKEFDGIGEEDQQGLGNWKHTLSTKAMRKVGRRFAAALLQRCS